MFQYKDYISPGSIGGKIKRYRELKGLSQKELGKRCGFTESTADVRIAQYEKNRKVPRNNAIKKIVEALGINEQIFSTGDLTTINSLYQALFDMEEFHGLKVIERNGNYYLQFNDIPKLYTNNFLKEWCEAKQKLTGNEYQLWKAEYHY